MKTFYFKISTFLALVVIMGTLGSCSKSIRFNKSSSVPSAVGLVKLSRDNNNNRLVVMKIENLVDPRRLTPSKKLYMVWEQTKNDGVKNLGRLVSKEAIFSTERNAVFNSVLIYDPVRFFITAEDDADLSQPGSFIVLSTSDL